MDETIADTFSDLDTHTQLILLAASNHDVESLRTLLRNGSASVQDAESGYTPLHAAIAACERPVDSKDNGGLANGHESENHTSVDSSTTDFKADMDAASNTVRLLLQNGAIWNDVDKNDETPGCLALRLDLKELYDLMVDAGVRAEILLNRLDEYDQLADDDEDEDEDEDEDSIPNGEDVKDGNDTINGPAATVGEKSVQDMTCLVSEAAQSNEGYLHSSIRFQDRRILDEADNGVMMAWETNIMKRTTDLLAPTPGLRILNIGHGMGIIDSAFQEKSPSKHHIIEAHPAVLERMRKEGWYEKSNVTIHEGRWQDQVPKIIEQATLFDAIYFDTFAEDYKAFRDFFSDCLVGLLDDGGKWGFFNGLGADRQICYDVYGKVAEMDLFEAGFDTEWETIEVVSDPENKEWEGVRRKYWALEKYKLPICSFIT